MNTTTNTIELPRLSRENFAECRRLFGHQPIDEALVTRLFADHTLSTRVTEYTRDDVLEDGEPTVWTVIERGRDWPNSAQVLNNDLPCVYDWCRGHDINEAETWDEILHGPKDRHADTRLVDNGVCYVVRKGQPPYLNVYIDHDDDVQNGDGVTFMHDFSAIYTTISEVTAEMWKANAEVNP